MVNSCEENSTILFRDPQVSLGKIFTFCCIVIKFNLGIGVASWWSRCGFLTGFHCVFQLKSLSYNRWQDSVCKINILMERKPQTSVCSNLCYSKPVALTLILTAEKKTAVLPFRKKTQNMIISQRLQEQLFIYFGSWIGVLGKFPIPVKWLILYREPLKSCKVQR